MKTEKIGDDYEMYYRYDTNGVLASVTRYTVSTDSSSILYAQTNTRGDVISLYDGNGATRVKYVYDSWGKLISTTDGNGNALAENAIGSLNSIRYRGYVYDSETGLYYLQSRYYNPEVGRFLNADSVEYIGYSGETLSYNVFAYCENDPVCRRDVKGNNWAYTIYRSFDYSLAGTYLELFLKYYLYLHQYEVKKFRQEYNDFYRAKINYQSIIYKNGTKIYKNRSLNIYFGDKKIWEYKSTHVEDVGAIMESARDMSNTANDMLMSDYSNEGAIIPLAVSLVLFVTGLVVSINHTNVNKKVYDFVWGSDGLDPENNNMYFAFNVSGADDVYESKNGYHAYSYSAGDGKGIVV